MTALPQQTQHQIYQQIPAHLATLAPNGHHGHSIYQPLVAVSQGSIYVSNMATLRRPQIPMHQQLQPVQQQQQQQQPMPPAHTLQIKSPQAVNHEVNMAATTAETSLYDRDKQIYKCSTLRQGGKFDAKYKPSILNCPLPEIPKDAEAPKVESIYERKQQHNYSKTLQRIPMKIPPQIKAIPPPRIGVAGTTTTTANLSTTNSQVATQAMHNGLSVTTTATTTTTTGVQNSTTNDALPPPPAAATLNMDNKSGNMLNNNSTQHNNSNNMNSTGITNGRAMDEEEEEEDLPPPPPPALNDDSNYAVTEL